MVHKFQELDNYDDYDPAPYRGGYDINEAYGGVKAADEECAYRRAENYAGDGEQEVRYGNERKPYEHGPPGPSIFGGRSKPGAVYGGGRDRTRPHLHPKPAADSQPDYRRPPSLGEEEDSGYRKPGPSYGYGEEDSNYRKPRPNYGYGEEEVDRKPRPIYGYGEEVDRKPRPIYGYGGEEVDRNPRPIYSDGEEEVDSSYRKPRPIYGYGEEGDSGYRIPRRAYTEDEDSGYRIPRPAYTEEEDSGYRKPYGEEGYWKPYYYGEDARPSYGREESSEAYGYGGRRNNDDDDDVDDTAKFLGGSAYTEVPLPEPEPEPAKRSSWW